MHNQYNFRGKAWNEARKRCFLAFCLLDYWANGKGESRLTVVTWLLTQSTTKNVTRSFPFLIDLHKICASLTRLINATFRVYTYILWELLSSLSAIEACRHTVSQYSAYCTAYNTGHGVVQFKVACFGKASLIRVTDNAHFFSLSRKCLSRQFHWSAAVQDQSHFLAFLGLSLLSPHWRELHCKRITFRYQRSMTSAKNNQLEYICSKGSN